jgi:hypothetical protein
MREPVFTTLLPPTCSRGGRGEVIRRESRRKYGTPRAAVEEKIATWLSH